MTVQRVLLGLGSNMGDRLGYLRRAVRALGTTGPGAGVHVCAVSPIYESDALLPDDAPPEWNRPYLNLAVLAESALTPRALLEWVKRLEQRIGRRPTARWAPREIDIDLLAVAGVALSTPDLSLPHRDLFARPFALLPAADLAPSWTLPTRDGGLRTAGELAAPWRASPDHVPFRTRRIAAMLTELVGIVNVTPDSFSDGGRWLDPEAAVRHARGLAEAGATVLDLGAESTRPGADLVTPEEEWARLGPVLGALRAEWPRGTGPLLSADTRHPVVAGQAVAAGADWLNDVTGFAARAMLDAVRGADIDVVAMHSLGIPPRPDLTLGPAQDPLAQLIEWGERRVEAFEAAGVPLERVILDPGIGFGKTPAQTAAILARVTELRALGTRLLVGHSRKSFLGKWFAPEGVGPCATAGDREIETAALTQHLAAQGVDYVRVHDVEWNARALRAAALVARPVRWA